MCTEVERIERIMEENNAMDKNVSYEIWRRDKLMLELSPLPNCEAMTDYIGGTT